MGTQGISDIVDLFNLADAAIDALVAAKADGEIDWKDLPKVIKLYDELKAALAGLENVPDQIKDVDGKELEVIAGRGIALAQKVAQLFM